MKTDNQTDDAMDMWAALLMYTGGALLEPKALELMWRWFVVPLGAPPITYWHTLGLDTMLGLIAAMMLGPPRRDEYTIDGKWAWPLAKIIWILPVVGIGAVIHNLAGL